MMKKKQQQIGLLSGLIAVLAMVFAIAPIYLASAGETECSAGIGTGCNVETSLSLEITKGDVYIGADASFDFGTKMIQSIDDYITANFTGGSGDKGYFYVDDLRGDDIGYYTTVQSTDLIGPSDVPINAANVEMKTANIGNNGVTFLTGLSGQNLNPRVIINDAMADWQSLGQPVNLIQRDTATNFGVIGKYGVLPEMRVLIPAYQSVGEYSGTLTYTLYINQEETP